MKRRLLPADRKAQILDAALAVARERGYNRMLREQIADAAGVSTACVTHYLGTMPKLRRDVMRAAIRAECPVIVGQGLAARDPHAMKAGDALKRAAVEALL